MRPALVRLAWQLKAQIVAALDSKSWRSSKLGAPYTCSPAMLPVAPGRLVDTVLGQRRRNFGFSCNPILVLVGARRLRADRLGLLPHDLAQEVLA